MKHIAYTILIILLFPLVCLAQKPSEPSDDAYLATISKSDSSRKIYISSIIIKGNKKTRRYLIEREMLFKVGDSIEAGKIFEYLDESKKLIYNTTLFTAVNIYPASLVTNNQMVIEVDVKEKWYIYPTPQFQLIDRNFNEWIKQYNANLERVIYGVKFAHYNFTGRRDQLRIYLLNGYSRNLSFTYSAPYSNAALTEGFSVGAGYTENREIAYKTSYGNKLMQFNNGKFVRKSVTLNGAYIVRKGYYRRHVFGIGYTYSNVNDSILTKYNPDYFRNTNNVQHIPDFYYAHSYIKTDNVLYPLQGKMYNYVFSKRGVGLTGGINAFTIDGSYNRFLDHGKQWYSTFNLSGKIRLPFKVAYINQRAFGFLDYYVSGLEYYVIDGVASGHFKYTLKKKILDFTVKTPLKKSTILHDIPFRIFAKTYSDIGYSYIPDANTTMLNNKLLYAGGFGLDIITLFDINLKVEFSFNQLGENGLFLHTKGGF